MIGDVKDTHANLWEGNDRIQQARGRFFAPFHVKFVEDKLVVDDFFEDDKSINSGFQLGDIISHINGKSVEQIVKDKHDFYPASNQAARLRDISFDILRSPTTSLELMVIRDGKTLEKTVNLYHKYAVSGYYSWYLRDDDSPSFEMLENNVGYVTLRNISLDDVDVIKEEFKNTAGIVTRPN